MITNDTARISARGNGFTDRSRITDFVLLKSAETAIANGYTHFAIMSSADASRVDTLTTPGTVQTNVYGRTAFSTYNPGETDVIVKPGQDVLVKFCRAGCGQMLPADEIIKNLGPRYLGNQ